MNDFYLFQSQHVTHEKQEIRKKSFMVPSFSVEFITHFLGKESLGTFTCIVLHVFWQYSTCKITLNKAKFLSFGNILYIFFIFHREELQNRKHEDMHERHCVSK